MFVSRRKEVTTEGRGKFKMKRLVIFIHQIVYITSIRMITSRMPLVMHVARVGNTHT
jgi:hypothetical protein